ncbi:LPXTG cell wall anchor domain-containing protein [Amycolatopsis sp. NPDC101161]|uniref:LPXTG cell wall anchor domain-containing protein n=1 Tax=Amycolatopsis sp. NPDC101161 TaxID=3363940 RepID=UPI00380E5FF1
MDRRQRGIFLGVTIGVLVVLAAVFALLQVAPAAGEAVDVIATVLMVAGGVALVGALIVLLRRRKT